MSHLSSPIADREKVTSSRTFCPLWQFSKVLLLLTCLEFRIGLLKQCWDSWWALRQRIPWCYPGHLSTLKGISDPVGYRFSLWDPNCSRITGKEKWASLGGLSTRLATLMGHRDNLVLENSETLNSCSHAVDRMCSRWFCFFNDSS